MPKPVLRWWRAPIVAAGLWLAAGIALAADVAKTTYVYAQRGSLALHADVYSPSSSPYGAQRPVIVFVHGGGWTCGNRDAYGDLPRYLAAQWGVVAVTPSYRLAPITDAVVDGGRIVAPGVRDGCPADSAPNDDLGLPQHRTPFPAQLDDLRQVLRELRRHAAALQIDPRRIAVLGASAGGHLVGMLGTRREPDGSWADAAGEPHARADAIVSIAGPWDLRAGAPNTHPGGEGVLLNLFGGVPSDAQRTFASPITHVLDALPFPPTLFLHGRADGLVPAAQSTAACAAMRSCAFGSALIVDTPPDADPHDAMVLLQARRAEVLAFFGAVFGAPR